MSVRERLIGKYPHVIETRPADRRRSCTSKIISERLLVTTKVFILSENMILVSAGSRDESEEKKWYARV